jgi:hypothetical protein
MLPALTLVAATLAAGCVPAYRDGYREGRGEMRQIQRLAQRMDEVATYTYRAAEARASRPTRAERDAYARLYRLGQASRRFLREVDRSGRPGQTRGDFERLLDVYRDAQSAQRYLDPTRDVQRGFREMERILRELASLYDGRGYGRGPGDRDDDYGPYR